ncbi:hypothetical protein G7Z17_g12533 [Cylindrodendrum hubeiense]|uniref:NAD(P)-binding domain-containing protein n=1 Tax=Cylindrodendrum hubeiense TaxID=595255 RepID=A0A9P5GY57_9HYPO|nr:hypothetical protein G7Z17_g12533 [Cylindrodendrum hubeiense]
MPPMSTTPTQTVVQPSPTKFNQVQPSLTKSDKTPPYAANPPSPPVPLGNPPGHYGRAVTTDHHFVDSVSFTIGGLFDPKKFTIDDPDVCKKGIATLLQALNNLRRAGAEGSPLLAVISTTGISKHSRDVPLAFLPFYHYGLSVPHADKKVMEERLLESAERWVAVRPSFLVDGGKPDRKIRVGVEDLNKGVEKKEVGYTISREDVGRWMYENLLAGENPQYSGKAVSITW